MTMYKIAMVQHMTLLKTNWKAIKTKLGQNWENHVNPMMWPI